MGAGPSRISISTPSSGEQAVNNVENLTLWNMRNKAEAHRRRKQNKTKQDEIDRKTNHKRLLTIGNKLGAAGGAGVGDGVMGIKEGT